MTAHTHHTAPTQFVEGGGIRFAYRRLGPSGGTPIVLFQHFTGTMDHWDPAIIDGLAESREVILFNNAGVSSTSGEVPRTVNHMARDAESFIDALKLAKVDLLGFSLGGFVAQQIALDRPAQVGRLVLVGTGPRGGEGVAPFSAEVAHFFFEKKYDAPNDVWLDVLFSPSEASQFAGRAFLERMQKRQEGRDPNVNEKVGPAQIAAVTEWRSPVPVGERYATLKQITQPTLVVNGNDDIIIPTVNSYILQQHLPNADLIIYADSNHGAQNQYPDTFVQQVQLFLGTH